jgi:ABC-2 type transport system ATP-binding protein
VNARRDRNRDQDCQAIREEWMDDWMLEIEGLTKRYGRHQALQNLSLRLNRGDVYGLIGANGAGKTTTFKIVATILRPTAGEVKIGGLSIHTPTRIQELRRKIGYMPDSFGVYEDMTVEEYLTFFAAAYDILEPRRGRLVGDVLTLVELTEKRSALVDTLSRGMQQRLGLARTLIHDPELLILDEPASGLDPRARVEIRCLLQELQKMGKTILISSHILADIGEICNRVGILEQGVLRLEGTVAEVLAKVSPSPYVKVRVRERMTEAAALLAAQSWVKAVRLEREVLVVELSDAGANTWRLADVLVQGGFALESLQPETANLERAFMELTAGRVS